MGNPCAGLPRVIGPAILDGARGVRHPGMTFQTTFHHDSTTIGVSIDWRGKQKWSNFDPDAPEAGPFMRNCCGICHVKIGSHWRRDRAGKRIGAYLPHCGQRVNWAEEVFHWVIHGFAFPLQEYCPQHCSGCHRWGSPAQRARHPRPRACPRPCSSRLPRR